MPRLNRRPIWLWLIIFGIAVTGIAAIAMRNAWLGFAAAIAFIAWIVGVNVYEKQVDQKQKAMDEELFREFKQRIELGESVEIRARSGALFASGVLAIAVLLTYESFTTRSLSLALGAALAWPVALIMVLFAAAKIGKPALIVSNAGITTSKGCLITWSEIEGLSLEKVESKGQVYGHRLIFYVPTLRARVADMTPISRLLFRLFGFGALAERINVGLFSPSESAQLAHSLCEAVWQRRTKRKNHWNPLMRKEDIARFKKLETLTARANAELNEGLPSLATAQEMLAHGQEVLDRLKQKSVQSKGEKVVIWVILAALAVCLIGLSASMLL